MGSEKEMDQRRTKHSARELEMRSARRDWSCHHLGEPYVNLTEFLSHGLLARTGLYGAMRSISEGDPEEPMMKDRETKQTGFRERRNTIV